MNNSSGGRWSVFIIGIGVGWIILFFVLFDLFGNKWDRDGYERGVRDCQANKVEVHIDTTLIYHRPE